MTPRRKSSGLPLIAVTALLASPVLAEECRPGARVNFDVSIEQQVANDVALATAYVESQDGDPRQAAREANKVLARGMAIAKGNKGIVVRSGPLHTRAIRNKQGQIQAWIVRAELNLESSQAEAIASTLGELQETGLAIGGLRFQPATTTMATAEAEATEALVTAFKARAEKISQALGEPYAIRQMQLGSTSHRPVMARAMMADSAASPAPTLEAGTSRLHLTAHGQIELPPSRCP